MRFCSWSYTASTLANTGLPKIEHVFFAFDVDKSATLDVQELLGPAALKFQDLYYQAGTSSQGFAACLAGPFEGCFPATFPRGMDSGCFSFLTEI